MMDGSHVIVLVMASIPIAAAMIGAGDITPPPAAGAMLTDSAAIGMAGWISLQALTIARDGVQVGKDLVDTLRSSARDGVTHQHRDPDGVADRVGRHLAAVGEALRDQRRERTAEVRREEV